MVMDFLLERCLDLLSQAWLSQGLNNVIRELVNTLKQLYGIKGMVYGIQGGYRGFHDFEQFPPLELSPELVQNIHHDGGTVLGSSRGGFDIEKIIAFLKDRNVNQLYVIGGDGTHRGAFKIHEGCMERVSGGQRGNRYDCDTWQLRSLIVDAKVCFISPVVVIRVSMFL